MEEGNFRGVLAERPGLKEALCALSFFRGRNESVSRYKKARTKRGKAQRVTHYPEAVRMARMYIGRARSKGWRGSIVKAVFGSAEEVKPWSRSTD